MTAAAHTTSQDGHGARVLEYWGIDDDVTEPCLAATEGKVLLRDTAKIKME